MIVTADQGRRIAVWAAYALTLGLIALSAVLTLQDGDLSRRDAPTSWAIGAGAGLLAAFLITRRPGSIVGWLFVFTALSRALAGAAESWAVRTVETQPGSLPLGHLAAWLQVWLPSPAIALAPVILVLFPDDRLTGRWSRTVLWLSGLGFVLLGVALPIGLLPLSANELSPSAPVPDTGYAHVMVGVLAAGLALAVLALLIALASLADRGRRSHGDLRQQILWLGAGASVALVINIVTDVFGLHLLRPIGVLAVLAGIGMGIFRYRLYQVDLLIKRTVVYGLVTVLAVAVYAAVIVVVAAIAGRRSELAYAAAALVVALVLRPLRDAGQDLIDRLFDRRTHSGVALVRRLGQQVGAVNVDPATVVATLRQALRDPALDVLFHLRGTDGVVDGEGVARSLDHGPDVMLTEVGLRGEPVAVLLHRSVDAGLLASVTAAAGVVLEHARLQAELRVRLSEVRASRARLVAAADAERRRIERDLHDGAQQRLVGLAVHIQSARRRIDVPPDLDDLLTFTVDQLHAGLADIRSLVHGILPPALATHGLSAALGDLSRPGEVDVECSVPVRFDPVGEATAWFVVCEAVANARKHVPGQRIHVAVGCTGEQEVQVCIEDDGRGGADPEGAGLRALRDRVEAYGGQLRLESGSSGTRLAATLPLRQAS